MLKREEIRIRDPFVLADKASGKYYLYGTTALNADLSTRASLSVYVSEDLECFEEGIEVFDGKNFWADRDYWAPEVHIYNGKYYMFASFKSGEKHRATQILVSDSPTGRFTPLTDEPVTPWNLECLDGTLWVENGIPYVIYCKEWVEIGDGEIYAQKLTADLRNRLGEPKKLFSASENPYVKPFSDRGFAKCYVTDGPFLYRENGKLKMLWSSLSGGENYCVLEAYADGVEGEWKHNPVPVFDKDGGHAMLFTDFSGKRRIAMHRPNIPPCERAIFPDFDQLKNR